ncbi:MAG: RNase adaptor protein RapZ, partial [Nitrospirae bacterium]|nr:RNase adaptor protein RapZ [Nitrospirota bacterium]
LYELLNYIIPLYAQEGRSYLTIGVGCTGGRHRSPALIEEIKKFFKNKKIAVMAVHRDLG